MFAIPGILGLIFFIYVRPQEFIPQLKAVPFLNLFLLVALAGLAIDLKLRIVKPRATPQLRWVGMFWLWSFLSLGIKAPGEVTSLGLGLTVAVTLYLVIAHGLQTFKAFQLVVAVMLAIAAFVTIVGVDQGLAPKGCFITDAGHERVNTGTWDGRYCEEPPECEIGPEADPGAHYMCEHVGMLGTLSTGGRVRYLGVLADPNEFGLAVSIGVMMMIAFVGRRATRKRVLALIVLFALTMMALKFTLSRSGQLTFVAMLGVYFVRRYGAKGALIGVVMVVPMMALSGGGRSDVEKDQSTKDRIEAWGSAYYMVRQNPVGGVGYGQFTDHHWLTAHNSYILSASELGLFGSAFWFIVIYMSIKIPLAGFLRYRKQPGAEVARTWGLALLAGWASMCVAMMFLSLSYHYVLWIYIGLCGAYYSCCVSHDPEFKVRFRLVDFVILATIFSIYFMFIIVYLKREGAI